MSTATRCPPTTAPTVSADTRPLKAIRDETNSWIRAPYNLCLSLCVRSGRLGELCFVKACIYSTACQQLGVSPFFDDSAFLEHDDAVRALHGRKPVRDDENGAGAFEFFDGVEQR